MRPNFRLGTRELIKILVDSRHCEPVAAVEALLIRQKIIEMRKTIVLLEECKQRLELEAGKVACEIIGVKKDIIALQKACSHPPVSMHNGICMICDTEVKIDRNGRAGRVQGGGR